MSHLLDDVKAKIAAAIVLVMPDAAGVDLTARMSIVDKHDSDLALPCFCLKGHVPGAPAEVAKRLAAALSQYWTEHHDGPVKQVVAAGPYVNMLLTTRCIASVIAPIQSGAYLSSRPSTGKRLMVEYSQPNTLKAFHVGHTRNVSIGDALVRLNEAVGHHVVAANFFGDEGAHVAKALWMVSEWLRARPTFDLDRDVPEAERGEWLGAMYASAVEALDLSSLTHYAVEDASIVLAKVLSIQVLPTALTWQVIRLQVNKDVTHIVTIVSDKLGFVVGDCVAFRPSKEPPMELHGIINAGSVLTLAELSSCSSKKTLEADTSRVASLLVSDMCVGMSPAQLNYRHCQVLSAEQATQAEADRKFHLFVIPTTEIVLEEHAHRHQAVKNVLRILEAADPKEPLVMLWRKTNAWSITEFERIYTWLGARFDVRFYESECSEPSRALVNDPKWRTGPDPVFVESEGALGADLSAYKLGFALVLKRDGTGLYATKDLALAQIKFDRYAIDQSIYVVDAAQTLHFKQVFKILERMGYRQASKCLHIAYGQVVLPEGKMSSRTGNVILFSQLCALLREDIYDKYLWRHDPVVDGARRLAAEAKEKAAKEEADRKVMAKKGKSLVGAGAASAVAVASHDKKGGELASTTGTQELWSQDQLQEAEQRIAVATIRYGMLRHDLQKDIVFVLDAWTSRSGDSGPYLLYAYARIRKMVRDLGKSDSSSAANFDLLEHDTERATLRHMHVLWDVVNRAADTKSPSLVCTYLFELAKLFSAWYETPACSIRKATTPELAIARLAFCDGIGRVLQFGLGLLGIATLDCM